MASVSGVNSSNASSLYGNRNVLSGLATGLDTESMIENAISGYRMKIASLQNKQTVASWKQEGYRNITDLMVEFSRKYTSFTSATNLMSGSFFNTSNITTPTGANAASVSATGQTKSQVQLNGVAQLASAARYQVNGSMGVLGTVTQGSISASQSLDLSGTTEVSNLSGKLNLNYGNQTISLDFAAGDNYADAEAFAAAINEKLASTDVMFTTGGTKKGSEVLEAKVENGAVVFSDKTGAGNSVSIKGVTGKLAETFSDVTFGGTEKVNSLDLTDKTLSSPVSNGELLAGKSMTFTLDGVTKSIALPSEEALGTFMSDKGITEKGAGMTAYLQDQLNKAFGTGKITASNQDSGDHLQLKFSVGNNSTLTMNSSVNQMMGLGQSESSGLNTAKTLGQLLGSSMGEEGQDLVINGTKIGTYTKDTTLDTILQDINKNAAVGVTASYSKTTNQFTFTSTKTGAGQGIEMSGDLSKAIFGEFKAENYKAGKDAIVNMDINGTNVTLQRSSNTFDVDGLNISVSGLFNGTMENGAANFSFLDGTGEVDPSKLSGQVTFQTKTDADKIVNAVKSMVTDLNGIMTALRGGFATMPAQKSNGARYEPLSDKDRESMSEEAVKNYEATAKQGLLFADRDLSALYSKLTSALAPGGADGAALRAIGISTSYSQGQTTLALDETKLREALSTNPSAVQDAFSKVAGSGSTTNGLMKNLKTHMDTYASVEGTKGILVNKAGSKYSALSLLKNTLQTEAAGYDAQISKWQDKLSAKVDYYTKQFTRLEQITNQMNAQSGYLAGLSG